MIDHPGMRRRGLAALFSYVTDPVVLRAWRDDMRVRIFPRETNRVLAEQVKHAVETGDTGSVSRWRLLSLPSGYSQVGECVVKRDDE